MLIWGSSESRQITFTLKARNVEKQPSTSEGCGYQEEQR